MRTMEATQAAKNVDGVLRLVEKNRESILFLRDGRPYCKMEPISRISIEMLRVLHRREARKR